jgi:hypothetical protein
VILLMAMKQGLARMVGGELDFGDRLRIDEDQRNPAGRGSKL